MDNPDLNNYVKEAQASGLSLDEIRRELIKSGWPSQDINAALEVYNTQKPNAAQEPVQPSSLLSSLLKFFIFVIIAAIIIIGAILFGLLVIKNQSDSADSVCGNEIVEEGETTNTCCQDVGCTQGLECQSNGLCSCVPTPELCDNKDNNCNGQIDDGNVCDGEETVEVRVLSLSYFPLQGSRLDPDITDLDFELSFVRSKVADLDQQIAASLTEGSTYHGYKTSNYPALHYLLYDSKEFLKALPVSDNLIPGKTSTYRPDYELLLTTDVDVCDYVDNQGVKEVWLWGYHTAVVEPVESNMAMGTRSEKFWGKEGYGDVSNSEQADDLPVCKNTYTLYNYNYQRGLGEALEDHGHHLEAVYRFVDEDMWNKFQYPFGSNSETNACGWTHSPPNTDSQYDWSNEAQVVSNCEDWHPDGSGQTKIVDCGTWYNGPCLDNGGVEFKIWWMQNMPGLNHDIYYKGKELRNWWEFVGDFDTALEKGQSLST